MRRQYHGMDRPGVWQVPEGSGEQGKKGENWLQNYLLCPNDPRGQGIDDDDDGDLPSPACGCFKLLVMYVVCGFVVVNDLNVCIVGL